MLSLTRRLKEQTIAAKTIVQVAKLSSLAEIEHSDLHTGRPGIRQKVIWTGSTGLDRKVRLGKRGKVNRADNG